MKKLLVANYTGCFKAMNDIAKHFGSRKEAFDTVQAIRREYINRLKKMTLASLIFTLDLYAEKDMNRESVLKISTFADEKEIMLYNITRSEVVADAIKEIVLDLEAIKNLKLADTSVLEYCLMAVLNEIGNFTQSYENSVDEERIVDPERIIEEDIPF